MIKNELGKQLNDADRLGVYEVELQQVERRLKAVDRDQHQLLQWAIKGFPEDQVISENKRYNKTRETLKARKAELEMQIKTSQDAVINVPKLESFIRDVQGKLPTLDYEGKRLALDMLNVTVWIDGESVEIAGTIEPEAVIVTTQP